MKTVLSMLRVDLLTSINLILKTLHRQAQSFFSKVILEPAKFTVNLNHITYAICRVLIKHLFD